MKLERALRLLAPIALLASTVVIPDGTDARVYVDGVMQGQAPVLLEVRGDGRPTWTRRVDVTADGTVMVGDGTGDACDDDEP